MVNIWSKFVENGHIDFPSIYCHKQSSKGALRNRCSTLVAKNLEQYVLTTSIFKYQYCQYFKQTKGWPYSKSLKKRRINWYLLFATPIHDISVMLMSYVIQSYDKWAIEYEAELTTKIFSSCLITFHGNVSCKKSSFS